MGEGRSVAVSFSTKCLLSDSDSCGVFFFFAPITIIPIVDEGLNVAVFSVTTFGEVDALTDTLRFHRLLFAFPHSGLSDRGADDGVQCKHITSRACLPS